jgi:hypothetical protein
MTIKDVKAKLEREPFRPFVIELSSGRLILVDKESELFFPRRRPELVVAFTDGLQHEFEAGRIVRLGEA